MSSSENWDQFTFATHNPVTPVARGQVHEPFPFDLAFSMTVHKAQGRTIPRVVIALTDHPFTICRMKYAAIFVAMSRVQQSSHLRLLEPTTVQSRRALYQYLADVSPNPHILPFLHGYEKDGAPWNPDLALAHGKSNQLKCG